MRLRSLLLVALLARPLTAQTADSARVSGVAVISGTVRDSLTGSPLAGAMVQLVDANNLARFSRAALSDSAGRFLFREVPDGRYLLGFFHPLLDSLGVELVWREVRVDQRQTLRADVGVPSVRRLRAAICGTRSDLASGSVIVGTVRNASDGTPAAGVTVVADWLEMSFTRRGVVRHMPRIVANTGDNGRFAMCNVPGAGWMRLMASRGKDSTDLLEVRVPADGGLLRHELYLGAARPLARDGHLNGLVIGATSGQPLEGAQVRIIGGPQAFANARGEWTLADVPAGTRMLEVRALGYYPARRPVHVVADAPRVLVELSTVGEMLDTVRIVAARLRSRDPTGFQERRHNGGGKYITAEDVEKQRPVVVSDLFRTVPGIRMDYSANGVDKRLSMTSARGACAPTIYYNGMSLHDRLTADDLDTWLRPHDVLGIEIYSEATVPQAYNVGTNGASDVPDCGVILIWSKR